MEAAVSQTPDSGDGYLVPSLWLEANGITREEFDELVADEVERLMLGDLSNWKPEGLSGMAGVLGIDPDDD
jgi:hypothetical protein